MRPKTLITQWLHSEIIDFLAPVTDVTANPEREAWPRDHILELARDAQAVMVFMPDTVDDTFLSACPDLKIISAALKGYDNFDVDACTRRGVWFSMVPDLLTTPTAELALGLLIGLARNMRIGDRLVRYGTFRGWRPVLYGQGLDQSVVGIIGMGAVGQAITKMLSGFNTRIIYTDVRPVSENNFIGTPPEAVSPDRPDWIPDALRTSDKTLFTPHLGSAVDRVRFNITMDAAVSIRDCFEGRTPRGVVNRIW